MELKKHMNKNDERILAIKKVIEEKRSELKDHKPYRVITNCSYVDPMGSGGYNLRTCGVQELNVLAVRLNVFISSIAGLMKTEFLTDEDEIKRVYEYNGYSLLDWLSDMAGLKHDLIIRQKKQELKSAEAQLDKLLSNEKQTELAIDNILGNLGL